MPLIFLTHIEVEAWKIRGVDGPLRSLYDAQEIIDLYAYRYDWDDHRRFIIADLKNYWCCSCH